MPQTYRRQRRARISKFDDLLCNVNLWPQAINPIRKGVDMKNQIVTPIISQKFIIKRGSR